VEGNNLLVKIIKSYQLLADSLKGKSGLPYDCDLACADFRAFYQTATVHVARVDRPDVQAVFAEVLDNLKAELQERTK